MNFINLVYNKKILTFILECYLSLVIFSYQPAYISHRVNQYLNIKHSANSCCGYIPLTFSGGFINACITDWLSKNLELQVACRTTCNSIEQSITITNGCFLPTNSISTCAYTGRTTSTSPCTCSKM